MILANSFTWANEFYLIAFTVSFLLLMVTWVSEETDVLD